MHKTFIAMTVGLLSMPAVSKVLFSDPTDPESRPFQQSLTDQNSQTLTLQSILVSGERQVSIINGQMLTEGDTIQSYQVMGITADKVILENQSGEQHFLFLHNIPEENLNIKEVDDNDA